MTEMRNCRHIGALYSNSFGQLEAVRKGPWRSLIGVGVAIGLGIEGTPDGIRTFRTGYPNRIVAVLTPLAREV